MHPLPSIVVLLLLTVGSPASGIDDWQRHLPPEWLGVFVVHDLPAFDRHAERVAKMFGLEAPGLARLREAAGLHEVTDLEGSWLVGLARGPQGVEQPYPFAMIPTRDFAALVDALDGDMRGNSAIVTVAEQDLLAGSCGPWALLMNPAEREIFDRVVNRKVKAEVGVDQPTSPDGVAAIVVSQLGLQWLADYKPTDQQASREGAAGRRKRGVAMLSLDGVRESLVFDKPMWQWAAAEFGDVGVAVEFDEMGGARVRVVAAKPRAAGKARTEHQDSEEWAIGARASISLGAIQSSPELVGLAASGYLAFLQSRPDDLGVKRFSDAELGALKKAIENAIRQIAVARFATLADDRLPIFGNRLAFVHVTQPAQFLAACDEVMHGWNQLIVASQAEVKVIFASEAVDVAGASGRRFFVDMVEAVDVPRSPEVTKVMTDMFGPQGVLNWYVVPLGGDRVFVTNVPVEEVHKLVEELKSEDAKPRAAEGSGWLRFDASAYVAWTKRRDRAMMGETIGGPRFVPLSKSEPLGATLQLRNGVLATEIDLPQSLLEALGKHAQEAR